MSVFQDLREAFRQAVANFREELDRDEVPDTVDDLLRAMRNEVVDARAQIRGLEEEHRRTLERAAAEKKEATTCRRREELARGIEDGETVRIAREFAERHERHQQVFERKASALGEEIELRRSEAAEMLERLKEARAKRDSLGASAGRAQARDSIRSVDDLLAELDRMGEHVENGVRANRAEEELDEDLAESAPPPYVDPEALAEARLQELKRRMDEAAE